MLIAPPRSWKRAPRTSRARHRMYVGAVALALTAAACSSSGSSDTAATREAATPETATHDDTSPESAAQHDATNTTGASGETPDAGTATGESAVVVPEALQFTAPLVGGGEFSGADFAGKPTLFWFWAPT